jgi:putative hydrolases of HD superfamily
MDQLERLKKQIEFIVEADKIKDIFRMNYTAGGSRRENDAEHSWHLALMAILLHEYANAPVDLLKVLKMILVHDIVEIDAGDSYVYNEEAKAVQHEKEIIAADRLFNILPDDQAQEYRNLWDEFEEKETPEARFAHAVDRLHPMLMNFNSNGRSWIENGISADMVAAKNKHMEEGAAFLWEYSREFIIKPAIERGLLSLKKE